MALLWPYQTTCDLYNRLLHWSSALVCAWKGCRKKRISVKSSPLLSLFVIIVVVVFVQMDFHSDTRLIGWDTVHSEITQSYHSVLSDSFLLFKVLSSKLYPFIHILSLKAGRKFKRLTFFIKCSKSELSIGKHCISIMENVKREKLKLQNCVNT